MACGWGVVGAWPRNALLLIVEGSALVGGDADGVVVVVGFGLMLVSAWAWRLGRRDPGSVGLGNGEVGKSGLKFRIVGTWSGQVIVIAQTTALILAEHSVLAVESVRNVGVLFRSRHGEDILLVVDLQFGRFPHAERYYFMLQLVQLLRVA